jgi:transposase-like protein
VCYIVEGQAAIQEEMSSSSMCYRHQERKGGRRPTGVPGETSTTPDVEVVAQNPRRRLTIGYKIRVIQAIADLKANGSGSVGFYLRKEGLYYSSVRKWMQQYERRQLTATKSGSKTKSTTNLQAEIHRLRRQLERTEKKFKKAELIVEIQKTLSLILGIDLPEIDEKNAEK